MKCNHHKRNPAHARSPNRSGTRQTAHQRGVSIRIITDNDKAAEHNEENFMALNYQPLVTRYLEQFEILWNKLACFENC
jgi:hypothetical protein